MRLFGLEIDIHKASKTGNANATRIVRSWSDAPRHETKALPDMYHRSSRLDAVSLIADTIAAAPIELYRSTEKNNAKKEPVINDAFSALMANPSKTFLEMDWTAHIRATAVYGELLGECFWIKFRSGSRVDELLLAPPLWCVRTPTATNNSFQFQPYGALSGKTIIADASDVVWFKSLDMNDPYGRGRGRTEAVGDELDADELAAKWQKNYFYNDALPPFWINLPGADSANLQRMKDTWIQRHGNPRNARQPAFTNAENMQLTKLTDTQREMAFVESREFLRDTFLQHFSIPPEMFGVLTSSNRATIDSAYYLFGKNTIQRAIILYESAITRQLIKPDFDASLEAHFAFEVPEDREAKLKEVTAGFTSGALTRADWKRALGYETGEEDEVYLLSYSIVEVPKGKTLYELQEEQAGPSTEEPLVDVTENEEKEKTLAEPPVTKGWPRASRIAHWKAFDSTARANEELFIAATKVFSAKQETLIVEAIKKDTRDVDAIVSELDKDQESFVKDTLSPAWIASMESGARIATSILARKGVFDVSNKKFLTWIERFGLSKAKEINNTTRTALRTAMQAELAEGVAGGESIEELSGRLLTVAKEVFYQLSLTRSETIARTETMATVNYGQQETYKEEGVKKKE